MENPLTACIYNEYYSIRIFLLHSCNNPYVFHSIRKDRKVQQKKKQAEVEVFEEFNRGSDTEST